MTRVLLIVDFWISELITPNRKRHDEWLHPIASIVALGSGKPVKDFVTSYHQSVLLYPICVMLVTKINLMFGERKKDRRKQQVKACFVRDFSSSHFQLFEEYINHQDYLQYIHFSWSFSPYIDLHGLYLVIYNLHQNNQLLSNGRMCQQARQNCRITRCDGFAQTLEPILCDNRPGCEIEVIRIPKKLRSTEVHCPDCRLTTRRQRRARYMREYYRAHRRKTNRAVENSADAVAEHGAESSIVAESRGAVGGGFLSDSHNLFAVSAETENVFSLSQIALCSSRHFISTMVSDSDDPTWNMQDAEQYVQEMQDMGFWPRLPDLSEDRE